MDDLRGRSLVSIDDLTTNEIETIFETADNIRTHQKAYFGKAAGRIVATLFYEPSTRTRLSFESAMQRLGGGVISAGDVKTTSVAKGESLADTVRVLSSYADIIVLRHPWEGAAKLAAKYASVPIVNAGDGGHEHPTQTLCDLYTLKEHHGTLEGLTVVLCGDLRDGRTIHSLAFALARFRANVGFVHGGDKTIPDYVLHRLERDHGALLRDQQVGVLSVLFGDEPRSGEWADIKSIYMTPTEPNQLALVSDPGMNIEFKVESGKTSIYFTRRQTEREGGPALAVRYPKMTPKALKIREFGDISILHPLPRVDELSPEIDDDPRSLYFKQASLGVPIRMALLWHLLGLGDAEPATTPRGYSPRVKGLVYDKLGFPCSNEVCITNKDRTFAQPEFQIVENSCYSLRCLYCDHETIPECVGNDQSGIFFPLELLDRIHPPIEPEHVRFFESLSAAANAGFRKVADRWYSYHPDPSSKGRSSKAPKRWLELVAGRGN